MGSSRQDLVGDSLMHFLTSSSVTGLKNTMLKYLWVKNFDEIALSRTVKETEENLCFAIFGKNSKIQNGRHFWGGENCKDYIP